MEFLPDPMLEKQNRQSKTFICTQCGECCHIREKKYITKEEEHAYKRIMFEKFGISYLAVLDDITINIWPEEKHILLDIAKKRNIPLKVKPKRAVYDKRTRELIILDYFIDHDVCPFYKEKKCTVYKDRPLICQSYPLLTPSSLGKCKYKKLDVKAYNEEKIVAELMDVRTKKISRILRNLIENRQIVPELYTNQEIKTIKELKL